MTFQANVDVIDSVLALDKYPDILKLREQRAKLKTLTQTSYVAALHPSDPGRFPFALRAALAARMAGLKKSTELRQHYLDLLAAEGETPELVVIADPAAAPDAAAADLTVMLAHVDLVTLAPREATRANIEKLYAAGFNDRDIVTLAGLIAFVNYQVLVVAGLKMLRDN